MKVLLISIAHNSLSQRIQCELEAAGHSITVELALSDTLLIEATNMFKPDIVVCPFLTKKLPKEVYQKNVCLIVHPGVLGDAGPSSLDWAMFNNESEWGVTVLQASEIMDGGDIWAHDTFPMPHNITKSALYKRYIIPTAAKLVNKAISIFETGGGPTPLAKLVAKGIERPFMAQPNRIIDFSTMSANEIILKIRLSDTQPGVLTKIFGKSFYVYGAHSEFPLAEVGSLAENFIGVHMKLPSMLALARANIPGLDEIEHSPEPIARLTIAKDFTFREIHYVVNGKTANLFWEFYNGANGTDQLRRLRDVYVEIKERSDIDTIILFGGQDYFSNGIHLCLIENSPNPAIESWDNINAIDDLILEIINTPNKVTVSVFRGNAGAGGVILGLASDFVYADVNVVLNPHYKAMGLYGSEYWTYLLPNRIGADLTNKVVSEMKPLSAWKAKEIGLVDGVFGVGGALLEDMLSMATLDGTKREKFLLEKVEKRMIHEKRKPLLEYRNQELSIMKLNFQSKFYEKARKNFVFKVAPKSTPSQFSIHRSTPLDRNDSAVLITSYDCSFKK